MKRVKLAAGIVSLLLLAACSTSGLGRLLVEGRELHPSLRTRQLDERMRHVPRDVLRTNPQHSTDADFVLAVARGGSQGRLDRDGIRSALYAYYLGERDLGFYGLEAESAAHADRLEGELRKIWSHNVQLDRARVHRGGLILVVVWTDGVSPESWEAANAVVVERLPAR